MNRSYSKEWRRAAVWLLLILGGLSMGGCSVAHMALPEGSQGELEELPVEGLMKLIIRNYFDFAPYHVADVHRGWVKGQGWSIAGFSSSKAKQKFEFSVSESGGAPWKVRCVSRADWNDAELQGFLGNFSVQFSYDRSLACRMKRDGGGTPARFIMRQSASEMVMEGIMQDGDTRIDISVTYKVGSSPLRLGNPTGYLFHIDGRFVGAVEVINKGTVWMHKSVPPETRLALASASAVLLMLQDIKEVMERN